MNQSITRITLLGLCAIAIAAAPGSSPAQSTDKKTTASAEKKAAKAKPAVTPFHGKLKSVDKMAKTISVGENTVIQITSDTKISKDEKPAILDDGVVGETVSGAYKKSDGGKLMATMVHFGDKAKAEKPEKPAKATKAKKDKAEKEKSAIQM